MSAKTLFASTSLNLTLTKEKCEKHFNNRIRTKVFQSLLRPNDTDGLVVNYCVFVDPHYPDPDLPVDLLAEDAV